eukprot:SAG31_NODE_1743_length_7383_cov_21.902389_2_plen_800_part_00
MALSLEAVVRPNIWALEPYRCARDDYTEGVLLDANENSFGPPVLENELVYERYPCPYQVELKKLVADYRGVKHANVFVGVGSDEAIDMLIRIFCVPGKDKIIICPPTYGMYSVSAQTNDVGILKVPQTTDFDADVDAILAASNAETKMVFLCSPGNPSCKLLSRSKIIALLESSFAGIVVVDEAYIDFAPPDANTASCCRLLQDGKYPNLVVLQTMSKGFGLAGIRCGFAFGTPELVDVMSKVKAPYNVNKLTSKVAREAYANLDLLATNIAAVLKEKSSLEAALKSKPYVKRVLESDSNFLMFSVDNASVVYKRMADSGVVVRDRSTQQHCEGCLRVTVGTVEENKAFLSKLDEVVMSLRPRPLKAAVQQYAWGQSHENSLVSALGICNCSIFNARFKPDEALLCQPVVGDVEKPFAELWMGTHPNGQAMVVVSDVEHQPLAQFLSEHPELLGEKVAQKGGTAITGGVVGGLPFLLKVLSVRTALSIQAHPDRTLAAKLHGERPGVYKDPNHKPELICALEPFIGMCGFRPLADIHDYLQNVVELRDMLGPEAVADFQRDYKESPELALKSLFTVLMTSDACIVAAQLEKLRVRLSAAGVEPNAEAAAQSTAGANNLALYLLEQYPGDVGVWCCFFLNVVGLKPGQALYLDANLPHAYIKGQGVEIMATSDNVVRAGLTPKLRDVETLCSMLNYTGEPASVIDGDRLDEFTCGYAGVADDFRLVRCELPPGKKTTLARNEGPQIVMGVAGSASLNTCTEVTKGSVLFCPAGQALTFEAGGDNVAHVFVATCNDGFFMK